jgi:transposase
VQTQHLVLLRHVLTHIDFLEGQLAHLDRDIETALAPFADTVRLLQTIPCVGRIAATGIVAEIGVDMSRFPSAKHLASWAGVCPGNRQSAGKRLGGKTTHGDTWLRALLGEVTWSIAHTSSGYLAAQYHRFARRIGKHKAVVAVSHSLLVIIYHMLATHSAYDDLGPGYFDALENERLQRHYVRRLEQLGFAVTLTSPQTTGG